MRYVNRKSCYGTYVWVPLIMLAALLPSPYSNAQELKSPQRWEKDIAQFEKGITNGTSKPGGLLFLGSSSIRKWDLNKSFPGRNAVNHGFGGSELSDAIHFFDRIVLPLKPSVIVLYAGDNDISRGKSAEVVHRDFLTFVELVKSKSGPDTSLAFMAIKPSLARWKLADEIQQANQLIANECAATARLTFVDIWTPMLGDDGTPRPELFVKDGLHLSDKGYAVWTEALQNAAAGELKTIIGE